MKGGINLAIGKQAVKKSIRKFFLIALMVFLAVFLLSVFSIVYNFILTTKLAELDQQKAAVTTKINKFSSRKTNLVLLRERLSSINSILFSRVDLDRKIANVVSLLPQDIQIDNMNMNKDGAYVSLKSQSLFTLSQLFDTIENNSSKKEGFAKIRLNSFSIDVQESIYTLNMSFVF